MIFSPFPPNGTNLHRALRFEDWIIDFVGLQSACITERAQWDRNDIKIETEDSLKIVIVEI